MFKRNVEEIRNQYTGTLHVQHIRKKVEPDSQNPRYVLTLRGAGYKFADL